MINMFSLVHGRANFIPPATNIDHANVLELLSSTESKGMRTFEEVHSMEKTLRICTSAWLGRVLLKAVECSNAPEPCLPLRPFPPVHTANIQFGKHCAK